MHVKFSRSVVAAGAAMVAVFALCAQPASASNEPDESLSSVDADIQLEELVNAQTTATANPDGSIEVTSYAAPINFQTPEGSWEAIDNTMIPSDAPGMAVENAANDYTVQIPDNPETTPIRLLTADGWVSMRMLELGDGRAVVDEDTATFNDVAKANSVEYMATGEGLKESIILNRPPAGNSLRYNYVLDMAEQLSPRMEPDGSVTISDTAGTTVATIPRGVMFDSSLDSDGYSDLIKYELTRDNGAWNLTVTPDMTWLQDASRVYPVTVDPTLAAGTEPVSVDCWISEAEPTDKRCGENSPRVRAGQTSAASRYRALVNFNVSSLPVYFTVTSATANLYLDSTKSANFQNADYAMYRTGKKYNGLATWNSSGASGTWTGGSPSGSATGTKNLGGENSGYKPFDVTPIVSGWVSGTVPQNGLVLKQVNENVNNVLQFYSSASSNSSSVTPYLQVKGTIGQVAPAPESASCEEDYHLSGTEDPSFLQGYDATEQLAMSKDTTPTDAQMRAVFDFDDSTEDADDAEYATPVCGSQQRVCILGFGKCGWDIERPTATVHVSYGIQEKINTDKGIPDWVIDRAVQHGHRTASFTADQDRTPYRFTFWEWECNTRCVRTPTHVNLDFVIDWNDGKADHGWLVTMFCRGYRPLCPSWVSTDEPYFGPPGPQIP